MLRLEKISKTIGNFSLSNIDFEVNKGDYFILIGESGAGKSMLLEIITGLISPDSGKILFDEKNLLDFPVQKRNIGMVYQKPSLFPHMTVFENIAYPLKIRKFNKTEIAVKVKQLADETEISHLLKRNVTNLSGGEAQRVTIARTLATNPTVLLLDEPLSYLDAQLKKGMMALLRKLNQSGQTIIHVTHDYEEAIALANNVAIIENGTIVQTGCPQDVFHRPKSEFVANFIGIKNFYKGRLSLSEHNSKLKIFETAGIKMFALSDDEPDSDGYIIIPSEAITISEEQLVSSAVNNFEGSITDIYQSKLGLEIVIDIGIEISSRISYLSLNRLQLSVGKTVWISFKASSLHFIRN